MNLKRSAVLIATLAIAASGAAPAGATTLSYSGVVASGDTVLGFEPHHPVSPTTCAQSAAPPTNTFGLFGYDRYAFRNASTGSDCITVSGSNSSCSPSTYDVTGPFPFNGFVLGSDGGCNPATGAHSHSFTAAPGQTFVEFVMTSTNPTAYALSVSGAAVVPAHAVSVSNASLPNGNTLNLSASSLEDGTGLEGTLTDTAGSGHRYSGPVRCLRVSGDDASLVMTFDGTEEGLASKWKGAVYWLRQSADGTTDAQRNSLLDQRQLNGRYATCPDPASPLSPGFRTLAGSNDNILVIENGPQVSAT